MNPLVEMLFLIALLQFLQISGFVWLFLIGLYVFSKTIGLIAVALVTALLGKIKRGLK